MRCSQYQYFDRTFVICLLKHVDNFNGLSEGQTVQKVSPLTVSSTTVTVHLDIDGILL